MILIPQYRTARRASALAPDLLSNLVLSMDLEEASGNALDSSGNSYTFTDTNTVAQTTGATAGYNARQFTSANSEVFQRSATTALLIGDNEWAAHLWVYRSGSASSMIFGRSNNVSTGTTVSRSHALVFTGTALEWRVGKFVAANGTATAAAGSGDFPDATWKPVLIWHNPLVDVVGIKVGSASAVTAAIDNGGARDGSVVHSIGATSTPSAYFNGSICALRVWRGSGVIAQIVDSASAVAFLNAQQRRHSELI